MKTFTNTRWSTVISRTSGKRFSTTSNCIRTSSSTTTAISPGRFKKPSEIIGLTQCFIQAYAKPGRFLGNAVYRKYFEDTYWIERPLTHDLLKRVDCLKYYFQLYAEFYGFDWKLIAALAYQESRFQPKKKSHAGAIGIMQIKPSTARDRNVNLPNISDLETNIHAGVKYLAFLRDRYFSSNDYTPEEKENFALAAYNAGPRKVLQLQQKPANWGSTLTNGLQCGNHCPASHRPRDR